MSVRSTAPGEPSPAPTWSKSSDAGVRRLDVHRPDIRIPDKSTKASRSSCANVWRERSAVNSGHPRGSSPRAASSSGGGECPHQGYWRPTTQPPPWVAPSAVKVRRPGSPCSEQLPGEGARGPIHMERRHQANDACAAGMRGPFETLQGRLGSSPIVVAEPAVTPARVHVSTTGTGTYANRRSQYVPGGNTTWTPCRHCWRAAMYSRTKARLRSSASIRAHLLGAATRGRRFRRGSRVTGWPRHDWASTARRPHTRRPVRWRSDRNRFQVSVRTRMDAVMVLDVAIGAVLVVGLTLVIRDTIRRSGRWGINLQPIVCPRCGGTAGPFRMPKNSGQALWGGRTCRSCGCHMDKWGRELAEK